MSHYFFLYALVSMSALLYAFAFIYSQWLWWLVFFYAIPLLYAACTHRLTAWHGFLWGVIFFTAQCAGLVLSLYQMAVGPWYLCLAPGILFILYMVLYPMVLFGLLNCAVRVTVYSHVTMIALWVCGLWGMTSIIDRYAFVPFGTVQGYSFINPLIPLACWPQLLYVVPYLGVELTILMVLIFAGAVTAYILHCSRVTLLCVLLTALPWLLFVGVPVGQSQPPSWLSRIAVLPIAYPVQGDGRAAAQSLVHDMCNTVRHYPSVDIIIVPESALSGLLTSQLSQCTWPDSCAHVQFVAGSNTWVDGRHYNCALWMTSCTQRACFAKRRLVPPIEYMPCWCYPFQSLYFSANQPLEPSDNERPCFQLDDTIRLVPYICSELFLSVAPDDIYGQLPLLVLVNDAWCKADYVVQCLCLCARFKAIIWQRDMVYASFCHAAWLSKTGDVIPLIRA